MDGQPIVCMMWVRRLVDLLPTRPGITVNVRFFREATPAPSSFKHAVAARAYELFGGLPSIRTKDGLVEWHFARHPPAAASTRHLTERAQVLRADARIDSLKLALTRH